MKDQLESTDCANQKLCIRSERLEIALKAMEEALVQKNDEMKTLESHNKDQYDIMCAQVKESEQRHKCIMEQIEPVRKELNVYKGLVKYLRQALTMDNPQHFGKLLEV
ncbi:hypothetical protein Moror_3235 [Moniliophthora roreri MCA 2997]|uniref:Uncharacterized protein n=1 Tax=Moniliophthora roreri (strain MCA 2997) TaxID=1381753 RepID=V2WMA9_MONRO|nr:hypothetical protein Moror_3235 [Moniliophthora roreri MCA 2997]